MRFVYMALIVVLAAAVILFKVQNIESVTVSLLSMNLTMPISILVLLVYVLGMLTGGMALTLVRSLISGATRQEV